MEQLRKLIRLILGVNATNFKEDQAKELAKLVKAQEEELGTYVSDVANTVSAKMLLVEKLAKEIAEGEATINELKEK